MPDQVQLGLPILNYLDRLNLLRASHMRKSMAETGVHFRQMPILTFVLLHPGCTQQEISIAMHLSPSSIALSTKRLEKGGFLHKKTDEENLRCKKLYLTESGQAALAQAEKSAQELHTILLDGVSPKDLAVAEGVLRHMIRNLCGDDRADFFENLAFLHEPDASAPCEETEI